MSELLTIPDMKRLDEKQLTMQMNDSYNARIGHQVNGLTIQPRYLQALPKSSTSPLRMAYFTFSFF